MLHVSVSVLFASFFFATELKQLISSQNTLQLTMQPTLFYAVAKQSLKKIQANNVSVTLMIFFAFFFLYPVPPIMKVINSFFQYTLLRLHTHLMVKLTFFRVLSMIFTVTTTRVNTANC